MNQPESRDQALLRARRLHWAIGHSLPKRRTRSGYQAAQTHESFFHYQGTAAVDTRLSSIGWMRGPARGGAFLSGIPLSSILSPLVPRGERKKQRLGDFGSGFQRMQVRVVMEDARSNSGQRRQDQVGFGRMQIAAGRVHPQSPRATRNGFPCRNPERQLKKGAYAFAVKILEGVAAPFVQGQVLARRVFLQQRKPDRGHAFIETEWVGLSGPVEEPEGPRIAMKMMLGLLVIKQCLCDCGIN